MSAVRSQFSVTVPATDLLSYIFGLPYKDEGAWPLSGPIILSSKESLGGRACGYSIDQIKILVKCLGNGLHQLGARGKRVMIYGEANIHFVIAMLGILAAGAEVNILATGPAEDLASRLRQLKCDIMLLSPEQAVSEALLDAASVLEIPHERLSIVDESLSGSKTLRGKPGLSLDEAKSRTPILLYTSGTTGTPKLACWTHYGLIGNTAQILHHYTLQPRCKERLVQLYIRRYGFHSLGHHYPTQGAVSEYIFLARLDPILFTATVERFKPTWVMAPPHLMRSTLAMPATPDFGSVKHVLTGGSIVSWKLVDEWQRRFGSQVQSTYGMTEAGFFAIPDPNEPGYLDEPTQTAQTVAEDGWIKTGDIGWINERGMIYIDLFKLRGNQVTGSEIETAVARHPGLPGDEEPAPRGYIVKADDSSLSIEDLMS
ncbi:hypothetical protein BDW67DRAFT_192196 [Aspergillus spinulosporus]